MLCHWHPRINNYNAVVSFLFQCNMDIKYIGLGPAAKALVYYISDYIMKNDLPVHIRLQALQSTIRSHKAWFDDDTFCSSQYSEKNLLSKSINTMMGRHEISHQRVMSYLVGGKRMKCVSHVYAVKLLWQLFILET
ncbi:hypothetical protein PISMIDRAFT_30791 [Pisolithus microcarpus 441]|uniref:Unplaced genomic scaffold scaffold_157, whole genome shotgun sequence n=1 Tax=Pisolithus microcarpus 441 TaxID=765257 RepID=A0A0C9ZAQ6_9AGAM|nr:hypothetical protein BKA83DRAFT_30791 [Pisolithus microcarpus]KIK16983.1 hypothetical protein PISMIDRAFT_30791 [Pisolithus microcarpus 441]